LIPESTININFFTPAVAGEFEVGIMVSLKGGVDSFQDPDSLKVQPSNLVSLSDGLQLAWQYLEAGGYLQAESLCHQLLTSYPQHPELLQLLASIAYEHQDYRTAIDYLRLAQAGHPESPRIILNLIHVLQANQQFKEALNTAQEAIILYPNSDQCYEVLADLYFSQNQLHEAASYYQQALRLNANQAEVYRKQGVAWYRHGALAEALACFHQAMTLNPLIPELPFDLAVTYHSQSQLQEAVHWYQETLRLDPACLKAYQYLGSIYVDLQRWEEAIVILQEAVKLDPQKPELFYLLGCSFSVGKYSLEAIDAYHQALTLKPHYPDCLYRLGLEFFLVGREPEALRCFRETIALNPKFFGAWMSFCLAHLRIIYARSEDLPLARQNYERALKYAIETLSLTSQEEIKIAAATVGTVHPYYLSYQGENDRELQAFYGNWIQKIMSLRYPQWSLPKVMPPPHQDGKIRVGIVSGFFKYHSVWKMRIRGWMTAIDRRQFHLIGIYTESYADEITQEARQGFDQFIEGIDSFETLCQAIQAANCHVLLYPEIGMNEKVIRLACLRLAPLQCMGWSHPITSGLPTIDYFLSSELMEPLQAEEHYTEALLPLPNLGTYYIPYEEEPAAVDLELWGLRPDVPRFLCLQSLFKYLPQHDDLLPSIAREVGPCQFVFLQRSVSQALLKRFLGRLRQAFAIHNLEARDYITLMPGYLNRAEYAALNQSGHIFLDTIFWSGCNTTLEALNFNLPIVTLPGQTMRSRHSSAILTRMGITATIATDLDHYIQIAARLAQDSDWYTEIQAQIRHNRWKLYRDEAPIRVLESFLLQKVTSAQEENPCFREPDPSAA
jgi:predicted O-linked N-acetylglucosamine transferase (SPINDLY family)